MPSSTAHFANESLNDWTGTNGRLGADPIVQNYLFEGGQPLPQDQPNPFEEGVRIIDGPGTSRSRRWRSRRRCRRTRTTSTPWVYLGGAQAQNEKEEAAIRAFEQAMKLDPNNLSSPPGPRRLLHQ